MWFVLFLCVSDCDPTKLRTLNFFFWNVSRDTIHYVLPHDRSYIERCANTPKNEIIPFRDEYFGYLRPSIASRSDRTWTECASPNYS